MGLQKDEAHPDEHIQTATVANEFGKWFGACMYCITYGLLNFSTHQRIAVYTAGHGIPIVSNILPFGSVIVLANKL
jgi:hypothetical protein